MRQPFGRSDVAKLKLEIGQPVQAGRGDVEH